MKIRNLILGMVALPLVWAITHALATTLDVSAAGAFGDSNANGNDRIDYLWYMPAAPFGSESTNMYSGYQLSGGSFAERGTCVDSENRGVSMPCVGRAGVTIDPPQAPKPSTLLLLGTGMLILTGASRWQGPRY